MDPNIIHTSQGSLGNNGFLAIVRQLYLLSCLARSSCLVIEAFRRAVRHVFVLVCYSRELATVVSLSY